MAVTMTKQHYTVVSKNGHIPEMSWSPDLKRNEQKSLKS